MIAPEFIYELFLLPQRPTNAARLAKELGSAIVKRRAVWVWTAELDLDTDGITRKDVSYEQTHQSSTSLCWPGGVALDANVTPYVVIPKYWGEKVGLKVGDLGLACIAGCNDVIAVIVGDKGPPDKIGEASIQTLRALGYERLVNGAIVNAGVVKPFHMLLFQGSGVGHCLPADEVERRAWKLWEEMLAA